ncbi:CvpA family protein [Lawsonibacter sp. LCP25S3_G6]|uniref:CvpA family protein n=1 Tax=unclassified Lawsonibacter TaxID=2617946 RepID=UPI003F95E249
MTYILFDIAIAAILLFFLWQGYKKGFVLTLCGFLAVFVAFIGATLISNALAKPVAQAIVPMIESGIHETLEQSMQDSVPSTSAETPSVLPEELPLSDVLEALQDSPIFHSLAEAFQKAVDEGIETVATNAAQALAEYIAIQIARTILFILAFAAVLVAWFLLSHALDLAFKLPVLSTLNHWTGAAVGLIKGGLLLFIAAWLLKGSFIPSQAIENTFLLNFFCTVSPFSLLAML